MSRRDEVAGGTGPPIPMRSVDSGLNLPCWEESLTVVEEQEPPAGGGDNEDTKTAVGQEEEISGKAIRNFMASR